jgi:hypothetical protein
VTVEHDPATDARGHDHRDEVALALGGADPSFAQGQRLGVVVDVDRQVGQRDEPIPERERPPARDVERRHHLPVQRHRPTAPDTDDLRRPPLGLRQQVEKMNHGRPDGLGIGVLRRRELRPDEDHAALVDHRGRHLRAANVDREGGPHGRTT